LTEKVKKIIKSSSIVCIVLGCVGLHIGGGTEGYTIEIVSSIFAILGMTTILIKGNK